MNPETCALRRGAVRASAAASETGLDRSANEDAAYAGRWLFAVADGLGGQLRQIIEDHTIGNLVRDVGLPAPVPARHPGRQARPFG
jgi:serine/threonine protein phosphatase PrpC